mgnify:CR=1 FL=1
MSGLVYLGCAGMNAPCKPVAVVHVNDIEPVTWKPGWIIRRYKRGGVGERNKGQFAAYVSGEVRGKTFLRYNKIQAQPFMVSELIEHFTKLLEEE